jgi:hypothetical protein
MFMWLYHCEQACNSFERSKDGPFFFLKFFFFHILRCSIAKIYWWGCWENTWSWICICSICWVAMPFKWVIKNATRGIAIPMITSTQYATNLSIKNTLNSKVKTTYWGLLRNFTFDEGCTVDQLKLDEKS